MWPLKAAVHRPLFYKARRRAKCSNPTIIPKEGLSNFCTASGDGVPEWETGFPHRNLSIFIASSGNSVLYKNFPILRGEGAH